MRRSLSDLFGFDNTHAILNASQDRRRREDEADLVTALVARLEERSLYVSNVDAVARSTSPGPPRGIPSEDPRTWRLRFTVADRPGHLAAAAAALADLGVNILGLDFHVVSATEVIDEATVSVPHWLDVPALEHALRTTGAVDVWAVPITVHQLQDVGVQVLRLATAAIAAGLDEGTLRNAISELVDAELVSVVSLAPSTDDRRDAGLGCTDGDVRLGREPVEGLPCPRGAWTIAVPDDTTDPQKVATLARRSSPFTSTEGARVQALLQLCKAVAEVGPTVTAATDQLSFEPHR